MGDIIMSIQSYLASVPLAVKTVEHVGSYSDPEFYEEGVRIVFFNGKIGKVPMTFESTFDSLLKDVLRMIDFCQIRKPRKAVFQPQRYGPKRIK
jgi:hypothetical protein